MECVKPAALKCAGCQMVAYCSKECQVSNWAKHKGKCKSPYSKKDWKPDMAQVMQSSFIDERSQEDIYMMMINTFLWGNSPAFDVINETPRTQVDVLFAASGDMRHMLESLESIKPN